MGLLGVLQGLQGHAAHGGVKLLHALMRQLAQSFQQQIDLLEIQGVVDRHRGRVELLHVNLLWKLAAYSLHRMASTGNPQCAGIRFRPCWVSVPRGACQRRQPVRQRGQLGQTTGHHRKQSAQQSQRIPACTS